MTLVEADNHVPHQRYNWEDWADGRARVFVRGEDFSCEVQSFQSIARQYAKRNGLKVRTAQVGMTGPERVKIRFYK